MGFASYWVDTLPQPSGEHLVHTETCRKLPGIEARTPLGIHTASTGAMALAQLLLEHPAACPRCLRQAATEQLTVKVKPPQPRPVNTLTMSAQLTQPNRRRRNNKRSRNKQA